MTGLHALCIHCTHARRSSEAFITSLIRRGSRTERLIASTKGQHNRTPLHRKDQPSRFANHSECDCCLLDWTSIITSLLSSRKCCVLLRMEPSESRYILLRTSHATRLSNTLVFTRRSSDFPCQISLTCTPFHTSGLGQSLARTHISCREHGRPESTRAQVAAQRRLALEL